jgi:hypothetical protein
VSALRRITAVGANALSKTPQAGAKGKVQPDIWSRVVKSISAPPPPPPLYFLYRESQMEYTGHNHENDFASHE